MREKLNAFIKEGVKGKNITIIGLGESGFAAAEFLMRRGAALRVTEGSENASIKKKAAALKNLGAAVEVGAHSRDFISGSSIVIKSPGVRHDSSAVKWAREDDIPVIGDIELGSYFCKADIVAITGSNGKSTTTALTGEILKRSGRNVFVGGNIGRAFCADIDRIKKDDIVVLEVSSFQLEDTEYFKPRVAMLLNISQNHLDRHSDLKDYANQKSKIFKNQSSADYAVLNQDDGIVAGMKDKIKSKISFFSCEKGSGGSFMESGWIFANINGKGNRKIIRASDLPIKGVHNIRNAMAAICAGAIYGINPGLMEEAIQSFKGLEHRFEYIGGINGVDFINDSKATSIDAARNAITSAGKPVILIAGGRDKNLDFSELKDIVKNRVKKMILIGEAKAKMKSAFAGYADIAEGASLKDALNIAYRSSSPGDCVLLSPMCTSFDMFDSFEDRGEKFKEAFEELRQNCARRV